MFIDTTILRPMSIDHVCEDWTISRVNWSNSEKLNSNRTDCGRCYWRNRRHFTGSIPHMVLLHTASTPPQGYMESSGKTRSIDVGAKQPSNTFNRVNCTNKSFQRYSNRIHPWRYRSISAWYARNHSTHAIIKHYSSWHTTIRYTFLHARRSSQLYLVRCLI